MLDIQTLMMKTVALPDLLCSGVVGFWQDLSKVALTSSFEYEVIIR